jgi:hypothetical protein
MIGRLWLSDGKHCHLVYRIVDFCVVLSTESGSDRGIRCCGSCESKDCTRSYDACMQLVPHGLLLTIHSACIHTFLQTVHHTGLELCRQSNACGYCLRHTAVQPLLRSTALLV